MSLLVRRALRSLSFILAFFFTASLAHAQFDVGSLVGTIRDQSGAVLAGTSITVTNTATNIETLCHQQQQRRL